METANQNKTDKNRPVAVIFQTREKRGDALIKKEVQVEARFIVWGYRRFKDKNTGTAHIESVGIVELIDGKVKTVYPENIQFTDIKQ